MWDNELFLYCMKLLVDKKKCRAGNKNYYANLEDAYEAIGKEVHVTSHTVQSWTRRTNKSGPCDYKIVEALEAKFRVSFMQETRPEHKEKAAMTSTYDTFVKNAIMESYVLITEHLWSGEVESEEVFSCLYMKFQNYKICIPNEIFATLNAFVEGLDPDQIQVEMDDAMRRAGVGTQDACGCWQLATEEETMQMCAIFMETIHKKSEALREIGETILQPVLLN